MSSASRTEDQNAKAIGPTGANSTPSTYFKSTRTGVWVVTLYRLVAQRLLDDGFSSMLVWVLEDNRRACRFYESLGGEWVGRKTVAIGGADLEEVSYGWRDIADLVVGPQI